MGSTGDVVLLLGASGVLGQSSEGLSQGPEGLRQGRLALGTHNCWWWDIQPCVMTEFVCRKGTDYKLSFEMREREREYFRTLLIRHSA